MQCSLAVALAGLLALTLPQPSASQVGADDQLMLFRESIREFAARFALNPSQIAIDSSLSGRLPSTQPSHLRARAIPATVLRQEAINGGFQLAATPELRTCFDQLGESRAPCAKHSLIATISVSGADIMGDSAVVGAHYLLKKNGLDYPESGMVRLRFERRGATWHCRDLVVEAIGSRPPRRLLK